MNKNFDAWYEYADMPEKSKDGIWFDVETGLRYDPNFNYLTLKPRKKISDAATQSRVAAKNHGGKALTGTQKQKEWGEKIRAQKIATMSPECAKLACDPNGIGRYAKFWINARNHASSEIGSFFEEQKRLLALATAFRSAGKKEEYARVAAEYNALTANWGFE